MQLGAVLLLVLAGLHDWLCRLRRARPALPFVGSLPGHGEPKAFTDGTYLDKKWWTANFHAKPGSYDDIWRYHPWRAPGKAPVFDACGKAGGTDKEVSNAGAFCH